MKLSEKILYCRKKAGLSQEALAEALGVSRQAVSKWETGDAVPEISKLVSLAKTFEVTADWLLSEEEPEEEPEKSSAQEDAFGSYYTSSAERFERTADDWMDRVPGILGKLVRRFGWIAGVYIAAGGAGFTMIGLLAKVLVNSMMNGFKNTTNEMFSGFGGFGSSSVTFYDESGNPLSASESAELAELFGNSTGGFSGFGSVNSPIDSGLSAMNGMMANNPVSIMANLLIVLGLVMLIGGTIFAVIWYKKSKEQK